jgi:hypothetical protein
MPAGALACCHHTVPQTPGIGHKRTGHIDVRFELEFVDGQVAVVCARSLDAI